MNRVPFAVALLWLLAIPSVAQIARPESPRRAPKAEDASAAAESAKSPAAKPQPRIGPAPEVAVSFAKWRVWQNVTIDPGQSIFLDSNLDFSLSDAARVSIRSEFTNLPDIEISAYWSVPEADFYNVADVVSGSELAYTNVGGAIFPAYGSQFRLRLTNTGYTTIHLFQVIVFARML